MNTMRPAALQAGSLLLLCLWAGQPSLGRQLEATDGGPTGEGAFSCVEACSKPCPARFGGLRRAAAAAATAAAAAFRLPSPAPVPAPLLLAAVCLPAAGCQAKLNYSTVAMPPEAKPLWRLFGERRRQTGMSLVRAAAPQ